jgi:hypothetical protein
MVSVGKTGHACHGRAPTGARQSNDGRGRRHIRTYTGDSPATRAGAFWFISTEPDNVQLWQQLVYCIGRPPEATETAGRLPVRDTSRYYKKGATVAPATNGQRELLRKTRWIDRKVIVALGTVIIRVIGQVLQNWIERGGHL